MSGKRGAPGADTNQPFEAQCLSGARSRRRAKFAPLTHCRTTGRPDDRTTGRTDAPTHRRTDGGVYRE